MMNRCCLFLCLLPLLAQNIAAFKPLDSYKLDGGEFPFNENGQTVVTNILTRFYVKEDGTCDKFYYKGSGGNSNNFGTEHECAEHLAELSKWELLDGCKEGYTVPGPCTKTTADTRYGYVASSQTCVQFDYKGCGGNSNRFKTEEACQLACEVGDDKKKPNTYDCDLAPKYPSSDSVKVAIIKSQESTHTKCHYAIVDEAESRGIFPSFSKCLETCHPTQIAACDKDTPDQDDSTATTNLVVKFYYKLSTQECLTFLTNEITTGLSAKHNYFNTEEECMSYCPVPEDKVEAMTKQTLTDACSMTAEPAQSGSLSLTKFYYKKSTGTGTCTSMTHGGIGDTYGLFDSAEECTALCGP